MNNNAFVTALKSVKEVAPIRLISDTAMLITSHNNLFIIKHITGLEASHSLHIHRTNNDACVLKEGETRLKAEWNIYGSLRPFRLRRFTSLQLVKN